MRLLLTGLLVTLLFAGCEKSENPGPGLPACKLVSEDFVASYGSTAKTTYQYQNNKLVKSLYFHNGNYNSTKLFSYDALGNIKYMLTFDSATAVVDTIAAYQFQNGLLKKFTHFRTSDNTILQESEYEYTNGQLSKITTLAEDGEIEIEITTNANGNQIEEKIVTINGQAPPQPIRSVLVYDSRPNPYYLMPDFIEPRYFSRNNVVKATYYTGTTVTNVNEYAYEYNSRNLVSKLTDVFSQGTHTTTYTYDCD